VSAATTEGSRLAHSLREQEAISARRLEEIQVLQEQLRQAADAKSALHEDNQRRIAELVRECEREVGDRKALQTKLDGVEERLVDVKLQLAVCQSQLEASRAESERREKEKSEAVATANSEVTRITGLLRENETIISRRQEEIQSLKEQLRQAADAKLAVQDEGQRRVAELVRECEREVNERKLLQAKLVTVDERMVDVKTQLAVCQSQLEASRADTDRREKEKSETLMSASAETGRVAALLKEQEALSERHAEEIQSLREQLRSGAESRSAVHEESQRRITELSRECEREAGEKVAVQLRLDGAEERLLECKTQLAVCQSQLESARADVDRKESEKNDIRLELSKLAAERDLQATKQVDMQQRLDDKEEQVREAMRTVAQAQEMQIGRVRELADERDALLEKLVRSKEEAKQLKYERDKLKGQHSESEAQRQEMQTQLQQTRAALEDAQSEIGQTQERLEESQKAKYEVLERHAVLEAEYRTYKTMCNTPTKLAEQLKKLVSLEGERASANSRISAAEVCSHACVATTADACGSD
jgi:chromosome segregation ATPase